mmetsp:Transcript_16195/g.61371  ORF Transcript_16195/g.61371 Transcript_16195/m.61371 type:complete len:309 (+) Transcript_16195:1810-2736(+)
MKDGSLVGLSPWSDRAETSESTTAASRPGSKPPATLRLASSLTIAVTATSDGGGSTTSMLVALARPMRGRLHQTGIVANATVPFPSTLQRPTSPPSESTAMVLTIASPSPLEAIFSESSPCRSLAKGWNSFPDSSSAFEMPRPVSETSMRSRPRNSCCCWACALLPRTIAGGTDTGGPNCRHAEDTSTAAMTVTDAEPSAGTCLSAFDTPLDTMDITCDMSTYANAALVRQSLGWPPSAGFTHTCLDAPSPVARRATFCDRNKLPKVLAVSRRTRRDTLDQTGTRSGARVLRPLSATRCHTKRSSRWR